MNPMEIQLIRLKENHFLNHWNKITYYDTSRMLLVIFPLFIFIPWIIQFFVIVCMLSYFISYLIFKNHTASGFIKLSEQNIEISEPAKEKVILEMKDVQRIYITYKFWKNRITSRNRQTEYNDIYIETALQKYKFRYIFRNNHELYQLQDNYEQFFTDRLKFRFLNLAYLKIDDLV